MIVLGLGYGDEGKGLTTSFLCSQTKNPIVVRFNGGHQAGHNVVYNNKQHIFSSFGAATLQGVPTYWSKYCTFYPFAVMNEYKVLLSKGITPILYVDPLCPVTTMYDVAVNRKIENELRHGSVGVGFGTTIQRHETPNKLFVQDLFYPLVLKKKLENIARYYKENYGLSDELPIDLDLDCIEEVKKFIRVRSHDVLEDYNPIFEGAQGILLDQDFGFFPNVTRSNTTSKNALGLYPYSQDVFYVTRSYLTRHGKGFLPNENNDLQLRNNENETNVPNKYQGNFRLAPLNMELMNYALECDHHFSYKLRKNLVITCTDQLDIDIDTLIGNLKMPFHNIFISNGPSISNMHLYKTNLI